MTHPSGHPDMVEPCTWRATPPRPGMIPSWDWARLLASGGLIVAGAVALVLWWGFGRAETASAAAPGRRVGPGELVWSSGGPPMTQVPLAELPYTGDALLVETLDPTTGETLVLGVVVVTVSGEARHRPRSGPVVD